jgi:hypothetical protein
MLLKPLERWDEQGRCFIMTIVVVNEIGINLSAGKHSVETNLGIARLDSPLNLKSLM